MKINYVVIILIAYVFGFVNKLFILTIWNKYILIQNVIIDFISSFISCFMKFDSNFFVVLMGLMSTMSVMMVFQI